MRAYFRMNWILRFTLVWSLFLRSLSQQCPSIYLRYSKEHSFCKPRSSTCAIFNSGVSNADKRLIVSLHNVYRSKVATGEEKRVGGLPTAADMMQMVWDTELEAVAQKRAEQCIYAHDCNNCRRVENFPVGQNIAYREMMCYGSQCLANSSPNWASVIKMFYDEVTIFDKKYIKSMAFVPGREFGHFTQMIWSNTWRIGCGYVAYKKENGYRQFYVCNYGPGGNIRKSPMYKIGPACSSCPINSCCGRSCKRPDYAGLCRMNSENEAPIYKPEGAFLFYCDFRSSAGDCSNTVVGPNKWKFVNALGGSYVEVVLNGGETSTLKLKNAIRPKEKFCLVVMYRSGPVLDGLKSSGKATVTFKMPKMRPSVMDLPKVGSNVQYFTYTINLGWRYNTMVSFTFSVPRGDPAQFFDIQLVTAKNGQCK